MSISIQYRGSISDPARVANLADEVEDIARIMGWPYELWNEDWNCPMDAHFESIRGAGIQIVGHTALQGICLHPHPQAEPLWLVFRPDGTLSSPFHLALDAGERYPPKKVWLSTETQWAGPEIHAALVRLLLHLRKRYVHDLELRDATGFPQSGDEARLRLFFDAMDAVQ